MIVALSYQIAKIGKVSAICLTCTLSFMSFWVSYSLPIGVKDYYALECFRSSLICLLLYFMYTSNKSTNLGPYLIYAVTLMSQTLISLLQLSVNIGGYTDPIYALLSIIEVALFIYGFSKTQRLHDGDSNNDCIDSGFNAWCSRPNHIKTNEGIE